MYAKRQSQFCLTAHRGARSIYSCVHRRILAELVGGVNTFVSCRLDSGANNARMGQMVLSDTLSASPVEDAARLRELFAACSMTQLDFALQTGIGSQAQVWQYLNPHKKGGRPLNRIAAMRFAIGLRCHLSDFSPSLQLTADEISQFATRSPMANERFPLYTVIRTKY